MPEGLCARHATTIAGDEAIAVAELKAQLGADDGCGVLFFCSPGYDLPRLGALVRSAFPGPVAGCTSSGQLGPQGFQKGGITAVSLCSSALTLRPYLITPLSECQAQALALAHTLNAERRTGVGVRAFGLVLVDGLSRAEERLTAALYQALGDVPIVGGSAGDDLAFERTHVYHDGQFHTDAAVFVLVETSLPFATFKLQHFRPTPRKVVVTSADPERRIVYEFNGEPAADVYAEVTGVEAHALDSRVFSRHPVMLNIEGEFYVRSIQRVNPDRSMAFYCAIEEGLVLTVGEGVDVMETLNRGFTRVRDQVREPEIVLGCDCILRRLELEQRGLDEAVGAFLAKQKVVGFSTYGEQFNALHVNQTFTGVALGRTT